MATQNVIILAALCVCANAFPQDIPVPLTRNTIFADERLQGEIFENVDTYTALTRNADNSSLYRLPTTTRPDHYNIYWQIDMDALYMTGEVEIDLYATEANVNQIVIHGDDMEIESLVLTQGNTVIDRTYTLEKETQFIRINVPNALAFDANNPIIYTLTISFAAELRNDMYGIYKSWYRNAYNDTQVSWMASTQFQATSARYAFPCYDEPSFKATFNITISRPVGFNSWSCTRRANVVPSTSRVNYEDDIYHITPTMSTYLLALIVAEYETLAYPPEGDLLYEVIARPGAIQAGQGEYAYNVGMELLDEMSNHTAMDFYSVHDHIKMTQAAIPDFSAGAMENWGLLTYREAYLMYDEDHTNSYFKQLIAYILSHEIAHMWFGNLVTCDWWDVLWLNEGFARYYQYFLTHWVEEEMGLATRFITEQIHTALLSDAANNPHPLSTSSIGSPRSVSGMFSTLSYNKGAAVIRMTEHLLGEDVHREGLRNYLVNKRFETALPIHLFNELQNVAVQRGAISEYGPNFSVVDYYKSFTEQPGAPVLNVQVNHQTGEMTILQRRFNINTGYSVNNLNYIVPITFATASNPDFSNTKPTHIISQGLTIIDRGSTGDEWVVFNKQQTGYYRVNYDDYTWGLIVLQLQNDIESIHEYNRAQIVNDVFQFARSGVMNYTQAFSILSFLKNETAYTPWVAAITGFNWIRNRLASTPQYLNQIHELMADWATTAMNRLTYYPREGEDFMDSYLRYQLATSMCVINVRACREAAVAQFRDLVQFGNEVPVDSRNWVYCNALREGSSAEFNYLYQRFLEHNVYTEKIQILWVLGCTPDRNSLNTLLDAIVQNNYIVRPQDYTNAFSGAVSGNEENTQIVFEYIQTHLQDVIDAFNTATTPLSYVSARLRNINDINAFQAWVNETREDLGEYYETVYNGAESSRDSIEWVAEVETDLTTYFTAGNVIPETTTAAPVTPSTTTTIVPETLSQPAVPELPAESSAVTTYLSVLLVTVTLFTNFLL